MFKKCVCLLYVVFETFFCPALSRERWNGMSRVEISDIVIYFIFSRSLPLHLLVNRYSLLHIPLFIKFSLLTTKQIISPAITTREKRAFFLGRRVVVLGLGRFSFLMVRWVDMLFGFLELYWFQKGAIGVNYNRYRSICMTNYSWDTYSSTAY